MDATKTTTTNDKAPAKVLSPAELADELMNLAGRAFPYELERGVEEAEAALAAAKAKMARAGEKQLRILRARSVEEAQAILAENPADVNLKKLCQRLSGWKPLQEKGATDEQIKALLTKRPGGWPDYRPYPHVVPSAQGGYGSPAAWVDPDKGTEGKAHLEGQKLLDAVRRVMSIPKPAAPTKPPAAKKAPAAPKKKRSSKAPAAAPAAKAPADGGGDDDDAGGAKASAGKPMDAKERKRVRREFEITAEQSTDEKLRAALKTLTGAKVSDPDGLDALRCEVIRAELDKRHPATEPEASQAQVAPARFVVGPDGKQRTGHRQTWGQWAATLRGIPGGPDLSAGLETKLDPTAQERFFLEQFLKGARPADARDAWKQTMAVEKSLAAPPAGSDEAEAERFGPGRSKPADEFPAGPRSPMDHPSDAAVPEVEPGVTYTHEELGLKPQTFEELHRGFKVWPPAPGEPAPHPPRIGPPVNIAGRWYAVLDAAVRRDDVTYRIVPVRAHGLARALATDWDTLRAASPDCAPEEVDLDGLLALDPDGRGWVLGSNQTQDAFVRVPRAAVRLAHEERAAGDAPPDPEDDDPNVDGRGVYVAGAVREVWVTGTAKGDAARVVIRVARGVDGMYRTGHLLEFPGAQAWQADSDEPVRAAGQAAESEAYAIRARANILVNRIKAAPGSGPGGVWTGEQKRVYAAAIRALENFIASNPAARVSGQAKAKAG